MTEEIIIDGELSCNNCFEKKRCKQQQETKKQRIDEILSYIVNEDNEKFIAELKNEIPVITRCDVVLEKQLKRKEAELKELQDYIKEDLKPHTQIYIKALEEIREIASTIITENETQTYWTCYKKLSDIFEKINEVLK